MLNTLRVRRGALLLVGWLGAALLSCSPSSPSVDASGRDGAMDGALDSASGSPCTQDRDCDDQLFCNGVERCMRDAASADRRGCVAGVPPCPSGTSCSEALAACTMPDGGSEGGSCDEDNDGVTSIACGGTDCDDHDPYRNPRRMEQCDGTLPDGRLAAAHDEDCNPCTVTGMAPDGDADHDGFPRTACVNPWLSVSRPVGCMEMLVRIDETAMTVQGADCNDSPDPFTPGDGGVGDGGDGGRRTLTGRDIRPNQTEVCDGVDNNCDGTVDEGDPGSGGTCGTGLSGQCGPGVNHCVNGGITCVPNVAAMTETCNGIDDNCDGVVDDGDPGGGATCMTGLMGICAAGVRHCVGGTVRCVQTMMAQSTDICNGLDDNCNGTVDEGDPGGGGSCATGRSGVCAAGVNHCVMGRLTCVGNTMPRAEVCNGMDDDCDGAVDNGNPGGGVSCNTGMSGPCSAGISQCVSGVIRCNQTVFPLSPNCNLGGDLNCNGRADNTEWTPCTTAQDPNHPTFNSCNGSQCAGAGACAVRVADTPYRHDTDHDGACVPVNDSFCSGYPLGPEWVPASSCRAGADDCDDNNPRRFPGNPEVADGIDNNCSGYCDEGFVTAVYGLFNPGDRADNMLSTSSSEAGWTVRESFFSYNAQIGGLTVGTPMVRCIEPSGRHFITQGLNNCTAPNTVEGTYGYLLAGGHTGTQAYQDCYGTCRGAWCEMTIGFPNPSICTSASVGDGLPWMGWPQPFGYSMSVRPQGFCWAP